MINKSKIIENIIQTFIVTDPEIITHIPEKKEVAILTKKQLYDYVTIIDSIQKQHGGQRPIPKEYKPIIWPVNGIITNKFRAEHRGIDIIAKLNSLIVATAKGIVVEAGWYRDLGKTVKISHGGHFNTIYAHLNRIYVNIGDHVIRGKPIGTLGNTGNSTGPHLHYEIHYHNTPVNPNIFIGN